MLPHITIPNTDGSPYLTRYFLFGADRKLCNVFIHHFHSSDLDKGTGGYGLLHSHPWLGFSLILSGGYIEERMRMYSINDKNHSAISSKVVLPLSFNYLARNDLHRVDLIGKDAWSIFFTGSRSAKRDWFFWDRITKKKIDWREKVGAVA